MTKLFLAVCHLCFLSGFAIGGNGTLAPLDNWHQWRGPLATGVAPKGDPPIRWDEKTNIRWKVAIPGLGSSSPIVCGDQVFITTAIDTKRMADAADLPKADPRFNKRTNAPNTYHQFVVFSIDRRTGEIQWRQVATEQVPHEGHHPTHSYAAASPFTDGKFLYVSFGSRGIFCFDLGGKLQWKTELGLMQTRLGWGEGISPVVHGDTLLMNWDQEAGSFIAALDVKSGKIKWKKDRDELTSWATPLIVSPHGRTQAVVSATKKVRSYDLATGEVIWECAGQTTNVIPSPVANDKVVFCVSGYQGSAAYAISLDAVNDISGTDKVFWKYDRGTPYVPSPLLIGGRLYFTQSNNALLTSLDTATGKPLIDRERLPGLSSFYASPVAAAGRIYLTGRDGTVLVIKQADKLEILSTNHLEDPMDASPAIVSKQIFVRGKDHLYCIQEK